MILTLYYMYSTVVQWWRLGSLRNKLSGTLNSHNAIMVCTGNTISDSKHRRCLENLLFHNEDRIGCTVVPKQCIDLNQWLMFPRDYNYFPVFISDLKPALTSPKIYLLLQAQLNDYSKHQGEIIQMENFGELVAWRAPEQFEVILKTDMNNLAKLVNCFSDHNIDINHELKLLRIETIEVEGIPVRIKYDLRYPLEHRLKYSLAPVHWKRFANEVKILYNKLTIDTATNKILDHPKITIENSSKSEETKKVPVSEVKPIKKISDSTKHGKTQRKESKNKLEVTCLDRRPKTGEHKKKSEKTRDASAEQHKKKEHKVDRKSKEEDTNNKTNGSHASTERPRPPKLAECGHSSKEDKVKHKTKKEGRRSSKNAELANQKQSTTETEDIKIDVAVSTSNGVYNKTNEAIETNAMTGDVHSKPPNVLVYADSAVAKDNVKNVLHSILNNHKYTIYDFPTNSNNGHMWSETTALVVVCGNVPPNLTFQLLQYLLTGGKLLCLCSDLLYSVLHIYSTAEVREHELVRFSYENWKRVKMMHHVFCYQASPAKRQFSKDSDQSNSSRGSSPVAPRAPSTVEIQHNGKTHTIQVQVLGAEETWQTPSLLLASVKNCKGTAIFSQVHLEIDPTQYQDDESKYKALTDSNHTRLEILKHILSQHLGMDCTLVVNAEYAPGYFLGTHIAKQQMLTDCRDIVDNMLINEKITLKFCGKDVEPEPATAMFLPILVHACPNFSTVKYFETLATEEIGRLVIYVDMLTSTQFVLTKALKHGLAIIVKQQTQGVGRSDNMWLSPLGCAMFSLQLHVSLNSTLGKALPLVQHLVMISVVSAIKNLPGYQDIDLGLKWPNDLYANGTIKVGGLIVNSSVFSNIAIVNIGCGVNLDNTEPTTCINEIIRTYCAETNQQLPSISYEEYFAIVFNEIERLYNIVQDGNLDYFFELYYKYWLHSGAQIMVTTSDGRTCDATIIGIDEYGFLTVRSQDGTISSVQPDGNTFDMMKGLIAPKIF